MNLTSRLVEKAVDHLSSLPGIGKRTALRLVLNILKRDKNNVQDFGYTFINLINNIKYCSECFAISENTICNIRYIICKFKR